MIRTLPMLVTLLVAAPCATAATTVAAARPQASSLSPVMTVARDLGPARRTNVRPVVLSLGLRDKEGLMRFLDEVRDPGSPRYGQFMSPDEFAARHAPRPAEERALIAYLRRQGLRVTYRARNRLLVGAEGTVAALERAFAVRIHDAQVRGEVHRVVLDEPSLPVEIADSVVGVVGLGDEEEMRPTLTPARRETGPMSETPLGPPELARFYNGPTGYDGAGQTIAIAGVYAWKGTDVAAFNRSFGLPKLPRGSGQVCTGGVADAAGCAYSDSGSDEISLDVEYAHATAPQARILNYMAASASSADFAVMFNTIVGGGGKRAARSKSGSAGWVVSISWGVCEAALSPALLATYDSILANASAIGQTWVAATGDDGSRSCYGMPVVSFPASSPHVVGVGGTTPRCDGEGGRCDGYGSETGWSGSGGGVSRVFARPAFQAGCGVPEGTQRLVPDVAIAADPSPGLWLRHRGAWDVVGGTSAGAPQWAGFFAQVNQRDGGRGLGQPGARLYALCGTGAYHDVTEGSNGDYQAGPGYDLVTGLGSIDAASFLAQF